MPNTYATAAMLKIWKTVNPKTNRTADRVTRRTFASFAALSVGALTLAPTIAEATQAICSAPNGGGRCDDWGCDGEGYCQGSGNSTYDGFCDDDNCWFNGYEGCWCCDCYNDPMNVGCYCSDCGA